MNIVDKVGRKLVNKRKEFVKFFHNLWFAKTHQTIRHQRKIFYALTPPPKLPNVGDHAQTIAIRSWLQRHFPDLPVIELDKEEARYFLPALEWLIQPQDIIILQSGGNMGDRGLWTEKIRRLLISKFPQNQIISLPQSIQFSDTPLGQQEKEITRQIYATHPNLTIIARDPVSEELALELFPNSQVFCMPDFALSLPPQPEQSNPIPKVLLCLRHDDQSILTAEQHQELAQSLPYPYTFFDTVLEQPIEMHEQESVVNRVLDLFGASSVVITDRFHGLVFSVLCKKPCVVLTTVDHKLTAGIHWFKELPFVALAQDINEIPALVEHCISVENRTVPDWNKSYFDQIPKCVGLP